jgi:hypothetical protein
VDGVALLDRAQAAGLTVHAEGDRLVVRGPRAAESLALQLLASKTDILPLLTAPPANDLNKAPCSICGSHERWRWGNGRAACRVCLMQGEMPIEAVKVWSDVLKTSVWVVADDLPQEHWPADATVYTHAEVKILAQVGPNTLAWVHATKLELNGRVVGKNLAPRKGTQQ